MCVSWKLRCRSNGKKSMSELVHNLEYVSYMGSGLRVPRGGSAMWRLGVGIVLLVVGQMHRRRGHGRLRRLGGVMHRGHVRLTCPVSPTGKSRARRGQRGRRWQMHWRCHPHLLLLLLHATDSGDGLLLGLLGRRDTRRRGGAELLLRTRHRRCGRNRTCWWHAHPRDHLRRRR